MPDKTTIAWVSVGLAVGFAAGFLFCWKNKGASRQMVDLTFPGGVALKMDVSQPEIAHDKLLEKIYSEQFSRDGLIGWLAGKDIFHFADPRLADALNKNLCDPFPTGSVDQRIKAAKACADQAVAERLRDLAEAKKIPFHYVGSLVKVGFPPDSQPNVGYVQVCMERELRDKQLELINPRNNNRIEVQASGWYPCTSYSTAPDIQLNFTDARKLFMGPLSKYENAVAVPLN